MDTPNYDHYSYSELTDARSGIDAQAYPERAAEIDKRIAEHPEHKANLQAYIDKRQQALAGKPMIFHGDAKEFFSIWWVNTLLTILTLGIYSAWATVRTKQYFYANTEVDGHRFSYLAQPLQVLKGRLIALSLLVIYLVLTSVSPAAAGIFFLLLMVASPFLMVSSLRFRMRMTSYRNLTFDFKGLYGRAFLVFVLYPIGAAFTFYLAMPAVLRRVDEFLYGNISYGGKTFTPRLSSGPYFSFGYKAGFAAVGAMFLMMFLFGASMIGKEPDEANTLVAGVLIPLAYFAIMLVAGSYYQANIREYVFENVELTGVANFYSKVTSSDLIYLRMTNLLAIACSLGMALPWVKVRTAKFFAEMTEVNVKPGINELLVEQQGSANALGDEVSDAFDIDIALT